MFKLNDTVHFIFESDHIEDIAPRLYGFYSTENGVFTRFPLEDISNSTGAWILVKRVSGGIEITQDATGCFGLFLYRDGTYWALSNNFSKLLDYLKDKHKLTFNREYADAYLIQQLCIAVYGETIIREIAWLDRRAIVFIDSSSGELSINLRRLREKTIPVGTEQGLRVLDAWHDKWASFVRSAQNAWPGTLQVDITGGFDTRMVLAPVLSSGVNYDQITFHSAVSLQDDFRIASLIAQEYGFSLNIKSAGEAIPAVPAIGSYSDAILPNTLFEKNIYFDQFSNQRVPTIVFSGAGGEVLRDCWMGLDFDAYIKRKLWVPGGILGRVRLRGSKAIVRRSFNAIEEMLQRVGDCRSAKPINGGQYYAETRARSHAGLSVVRFLFSQRYRQTPLLDPLILTLRNAAEEDHSLLIAALILTRYHDKLASLPFQNGRSIPEETLEVARQLNASFPRKARHPHESGLPSGGAAWEFLQPAQGSMLADMHSDDASPIDERLIRAFESPTVQRVSRKLYGTTAKSLISIDRDKGHPNANKHALVAIAKAYEDARLGKDACKNFGSFVEACCLEAVVETPEAENTF